MVERIVLMHNRFFNKQLSDEKLFSVLQQVYTLVTH